MKTTQPTNVLIVDDHQVLIDGIKSILLNQKNIHVGGTATSGNQAIALIQELEIDLVLLDINMPGLDGIQTCGTLLKIAPSLKIIALTMHNEYAYIQKMLDMGAHGYLLKNSGKEEILLAIDQVMQNRSYFNSDVTRTIINGMKNQQRATKEEGIKLTKREMEVLQLITDGQTTADIAKQLFVSASTVETHRKKLLRKLEVKNTAGLVRKAFQLKLIPMNE